MIDSTVTVLSAGEVEAIVRTHASSIHSNAPRNSFSNPPPPTSDHPHHPRQPHAGTNAPAIDVDPGDVHPQEVAIHHEPAVPAFSIYLPNGHAHTSSASESTCYSSTCRNHTQVTRRCYTPACRHRSSKWRCLAIKQMFARIQIFCALRVQSESPFVSFVPRALHDYLRELAAAGPHDEVPYGTTQLAAVLFADASGFTALTERLSYSVIIECHGLVKALIRQQPNGAEQLCDILNRFFSLLVKIVHSFNGDIVKVGLSCSISSGSSLNHVLSLPVTL